MYAEDAVIEDPVGPSMFDPDGRGHHGHEAIRAFWELAIAPIASFRFVIHDSHANGNTCANIGTITTTFPDGGVVDTDLVMVYTVRDDGTGRLDAGLLGARARDGHLPEGVERRHVDGVLRDPLDERTQGAPVRADPVEHSAASIEVLEAVGPADDSDLRRSRSIRGWSASYPRGAVLSCSPPISQPSRSYFFEQLLQRRPGLVVGHRVADRGQPRPPDAS